MALLFRAYFANSYGGYIRKTKTGVPTNAIYGFMQYLFDAINSFEPSHIVCCWDTGGPTFRSEWYGEYKANRPEPPADLIPQFDLVKDAVRDLGILNVGVPGYEADDCIGTLAKRLSQHGDVLILSGDQDLLQLVSENVRVAIMKKGLGNYRVYDPDTLWEEKRITPAQVIDLKAFMGDASDNYPGVRGIGEKTALKLLHQFGSVEGVLENLDSLSGSIRAKIEADLDMLLLSKKLATIHTQAPVQCSLDECFWTLQEDTAIRRFRELEMEGLLRLIG